MSSMGQKLGGLWDRVQGKKKVHWICDDVFDQCKEGDVVVLEKLHLAILMVYNDINKYFPSPHKEAPSMGNVRAEIEVLKRGGVEGVDKEQFRALIMTKWAQKDLNKYVTNKIVLSFLAAPAMAAFTKNAGKEMPRVGEVVDRIPTPALVIAYTISFVLFQDVGV